MNRFVGPEFMNDAPEDQAQASLADLRRINRWFGGAAPLRHALRGFENATILDVGSASGEIARLLSGARVVSLDLLHRNLHRAPGERVCADAFRLPFADGAFDVVASSLFLHHFEDPQAASLLREFGRVAQYRVALVDLERHWIAERFLGLTRPLFRWTELTIHDGEVSVRAAFRPGELAALATRAQLTQVRVKRHTPWFRLSMVATPDRG